MSSGMPSSSQGSVTAPVPGTPAWDERSLAANPHAVADKRERVRRMFAAIASSYDLNNRLHSAWIDQHWRNRAVEISGLKSTDRVVDVACGTGDLTIKFAAGIGMMHLQAGTQPDRPQVVGVDFTYEMLPLARRKTDLLDDEVRAQDERDEDWYTGIATFVTGDAQNLPLPDACTDVVSIAFGIRNVQDPLAALKEFRRVLRPGGRVVVLEFSVPTNPVFRGMYNFYCSKVMPLTATWISGDKSGAYKYLPHSVETFLTKQQMTEKLLAAGFRNVVAKPLTFGAVVVYRGEV